jgi:hypothetical protein
MEGAWRSLRPEQADDDGLWRLADSSEAVDRSQVLMKIEGQFWTFDQV